MANRVKSLSHGIKEVANPYEMPKQTKKSTRHRNHRATKNNRRILSKAKTRIYKLKLEQVRLEDLET